MRDPKVLEAGKMNLRTIPFMLLGFDSASRIVKNNDMGAGSIKHQNRDKDSGWYNLNMKTQNQNNNKIPNIIMAIAAVLSIAFGGVQLYVAGHTYNVGALDESCENEGDYEYYSTHPEIDKAGMACKYAARALVNADVMSGRTIGAIGISTGIILLAILLKK